MEYPSYSYPVESLYTFEKFVKLAKGQTLFIRIPAEQTVSQENTFAVHP